MSEKPGLYNARPTKTAVDAYGHILQGENPVNLVLSNEQAAAALRAYDYGLSALNEDELRQIDVIMSLIKDQLWP